MNYDDFISKYREEDITPRSYMVKTTTDYDTGLDVWLWTKSFKDLQEFVRVKTNEFLREVILIEEDDYFMPVEELIEKYKDNIDSKKEYDCLLELSKIMNKKCRSFIDLENKVSEISEIFSKLKADYFMDIFKSPSKAKDFLNDVDFSDIEESYYDLFYEVG